LTPYKQFFHRFDQIPDSKRLSQILNACLCKELSGLWRYYVAGEEQKPLIRGTRALHQPVEIFAAQADHQVITNDESIFGGKNSVVRLSPGNGNLYVRTMSRKHIGNEFRNLDIVIHNEDRHVPQHPH